MPHCTIASIVQSLPKSQGSKLKRASEFSRTYLSGIKRRSGESYADHCEEVALTLSESTQDSSLLCVAILHDLLVHPDAHNLLKQAPLSEAEKLLVQDMHALRRLHIDESNRDLQRVIDAFLQQPQLLPLRMAHRLNDVRHLQRFTASLRAQIANETLHMYCALGGRLGMHAWRYEMEDVCFRYLHPSIARKLGQQFAKLDQIDHTCITQAKKYLRTKLQKEKIPCRMEYRIKSLYSTYRKMVIKQREFDELTDRLAIRIIVNNAMDCYKALAIVHNAMHPMPGKLKDYIGAPKENGYRSIHTVVYPLPGVTEQPLEIQIRSEEMDLYCEYGRLTHDKYKSTQHAVGAKTTRVNLFRNLGGLREEATSPKQFEEALRKYYRSDHMAIFDHENNLYHIRKPATVLDVVCTAFPRRFGLLKSVKVNGRKSVFGTTLQDGDVIEPMFGRSKTVKNEWAKHCAHKATKACIRSS